MNGHTVLKKLSERSKITFKWLFVTVELVYPVHGTRSRIEFRPFVTSSLFFIGPVERMEGRTDEGRGPFT